jgi:hypothetical protein
VLGSGADATRGRRCYARGVNKIIRELLFLLWKTLKIVVWKWLRPMLGRIVLWSVIIAALVVVAIVLVASL